MSEITLIKEETKELLKEPQQFQVEVLNNLAINGIGGKKIADKLGQLLNAKTLSNTGEIMNDNKSQLEALKLVLKLNGAKIDSGPNINFFNIPNPNDNLRY